MRRLLLLVCSITLADTMLYAALVPLLPHYADEFGLSKGQAGLLVGAYALGVHGRPRATGDLDVWVAGGDDAAATSKAGCLPRPRHIVLVGLAFAHACIVPLLSTLAFADRASR